ncbi:hypothetical protein PQX77_020174 [Marasmius sp. AFHP31]|nr:hypothetical protein PQX77_020174 [Marasmius sp. AFHP31]
MARDMFGLDVREYAKKSTTTKDLNIVWSKGTFVSSPSLAPMFPVPHPQTQPQAWAHSAETTILLDDSELKARMQPWNHICIKEYSARLRRVDLEVWQGTSSRTKKKQEQEQEQDVPGTFDETILSIIGVLEALKHQSNVGAWIRHGGLLTGGRTISSLERNGAGDLRTLWFDDVEVAGAWAVKGKEALSELGIELVHGIHG